MIQEFAQQVEKVASGVVNDIHTAIPGKIVSYNSQSNLAVIQPVGMFITPKGGKVEYPVITDVPVAFPYCQTADVGVTFPIKNGDRCIIIISECELDQWRSGAISNAPLRFDLTSAMIVPGLVLGGTDNTSQAIAEDAVVINAGGVKIVVRHDGVNITGNVSINGDLHVSGTSTVAGIVLNTHTHGGVESGGGRTSGPG